VSTVSRNGAGFCLTRKCDVGRLISLVMPLPDELRAYDHDAELYPVLGLVQYCNPSTINGETVYHVGVAFVGKSIPESFKADPRQTYRISGLNEQGLWQIAEAKTAFKMRKNQRYSIPVEVTVSLLKNKNKDVSKETTTTSNISMSGLSVPCTLEAETNDRVKVASKEHDFYCLAVVRNRSTPKSGPTTLHLEFVDTVFPMEKIYALHAADLAAKAAGLESARMQNEIVGARPQNPNTAPPPATTSGQFEFHRY